MLEGSFIVAATVVLAAVTIAILAFCSTPRSKPDGQGPFEWNKSYVMDHLDDHFEALTTQVDRTAYKDPYGKWERGSVYREVGKFFDSVVASGRRFQSSERDYWIGQIAGCMFVFLEMGGDEVPTTSRSNDGLDYERIVGRTLAGLGFSISYTPRSGDQGVDLIADRAALRLAIQCKCYAAPVGNDAVQQVYSGAAFYGTNKALVIAPNGFTPAALALARKLHVMCLHHDDLDDVIGEFEDDYVRPPSAGAA